MPATAVVRRWRRIRVVTPLHRRQCGDATPNLGLAGDGDAAEGRASSGGTRRRRLRTAAFIALIAVVAPVWWLTLAGGSVAGLYVADKSYRWASTPLVCARFELDAPRWRRIHRDFRQDLELDDREWGWIDRTSDRLVRCESTIGLNRREVRQMLGRQTNDNWPEWGPFSHTDPVYYRRNWLGRDTGFLFGDSSDMFIQFDRRTGRAVCAGFTASMMSWWGHVTFEDRDTKGPRC